MGCHFIVELQEFFAWSACLSGHRYPQCISWVWRFSSFIVTFKEQTLFSFDDANNFFCFTKFVYGWCSGITPETPSPVSRLQTHTLFFQEVLF